MARFGSGFSPPGGYGPGNTVQIHVQNLGYFLGRFKQHKAGVELQATAIKETLASEVVIVAKDLVAVDTEKTKDSIRKEREGRDLVVLVDRLGDRPEVPIYLEIGTYKMAARPFLKPAADLVLSAGGIQRAAQQVGGLLAPAGKGHV